jgi:hypothetical protein
MPIMADITLDNFYGWSKIHKVALALLEKAFETNKETKTVIPNTS